MPRQARVKSETGIYHIVMRGINKQELFEDDEDYLRLLGLISSNKAKSGFEVYAYCIMGNHFHLLLKEGSEEIGCIMRRIATSFVYWYNWKYERCGHLFQDRFKSEPIQTDAYLVTAIRYIHQNPVTAGLCTSPEQYPYSSFQNYLIMKTEGLVDLKSALELVDRQDIISESAAEAPPSLEAYSDSRITDKYARILIEQVSECKSVADFQALNSSTRDQCLSQLRKNGLSIRQVSRLTGIPFGVVRKCR